MFQKAGVMPKQHLSRFFVTPNAAIQPGKIKGTLYTIASLNFAPSPIAAGV